MIIAFDSRKKTLIVHIEGEIDHHSASEIRTTIDKEIKRNYAKNLVFDFEKLNFMDSSGIGVILGRYKLISNLEGRIVIANPTSQVKKIIYVSGLHKIINSYDDLSTALNNL